MNAIQIVTAAAACSILPAQTSAQDWLIGDLASGLHSYAQGSGSAMSIGAAPRQLVGIDFAGDGMLYGVTTWANGNGLYSIDPNSGASDLIGATGLAQIVEGDVAYDHTTNQLFANYSDISTNNIYTINLNTGLATLVGPSEEDDISGLAFDAAGRMWAVDTNTNGSRVLDLLEIDKTNGDVLSRNSLGVLQFSAVLGMDFNSITNELYMALGNGDFYSIDTGLATASFVDTLNVSGTTGLAFVVPAPGAFTMLALAGLCTARRSR